MRLTNDQWERLFLDAVIAALAVALVLLLLATGCTSITYTEGTTTVRVVRVFSRASIRSMTLTGDAEGTREVLLQGYASNPDVEAIEAAVGAAVSAAVKAAGVP